VAKDKPELGRHDPLLLCPSRRYGQGRSGREKDLRTTQCTAYP
jgi:hypothetical protein